MKRTQLILASLKKCPVVKGHPARIFAVKMIAFRSAQENDGHPKPNPVLTFLRLASRMGEI